MTSLCTLLGRVFGLSLAFIAAAVPYSAACPGASATGAAAPRTQQTIRTLQLNDRFAIRKLTFVSRMVNGRLGSIPAIRFEWQVSH